LRKAPAKEPTPLDEEATESENGDDGSPKLATPTDNGSSPDKEDSGGKKTVVVSTGSRTTVQEDVDDTTMAAKVTAAVGSEKDEVKPKAATRKKRRKVKRVVVDIGRSRSREKANPSSRDVKLAPVRRKQDKGET
jgi:hypothetical protein